MKKPMDLNELAAELAKMDAPEGKNVDVVDVKVVLGLLGRKLRRCGMESKTRIWLALLETAGKRAGKGKG